MADLRKEFELKVARMQWDTFCELFEDSDNLLGSPYGVFSEALDEPQQPNKNMRKESRRTSFKTRFDD